jgi:hypothetical protein
LSCPEIWGGATQIVRPEPPVPAVLAPAPD